MSAPPLLFDLVKQDHLLFVRLDGVLDEHNRLAGRLPQVTGTPVLIHLAKVTRVTSCGVRDWVLWVRELEERGNLLHFLECSAPVVQQVNAVTNFCGARGTVVSFQAPYFCAVCDRPQNETLNVLALGPARSAPSVACERCGELLEFDDLESAYFGFTTQHASRPLNPQVQASLHKFADAHLATRVAALKELTSGRGAITPAVSTEDSRTPHRPPTKR